MTEIQRLLTATIDDLNIRESAIIARALALALFANIRPVCRNVCRRLATLIVMLKSETLVDSVWLLVVLFVVFNAFSF